MPVWYSSCSDPALQLLLKENSPMTGYPELLLRECVRKCSLQWTFCISKVLDTEVSYIAWFYVNHNLVKSPDLLVDLHIGNIAFTSPPLDSKSEETVLERLGSPQTGLVRALDGQSLPPGMPRYLVWPAKIPIDKSTLKTPIKLIDFGESFLAGDRPRTLRTPLALRAPELLLGDQWDFRADLWTLGCTVSHTTQRKSKLYLILNTDV
jgi:hypothetical protein